MEQIRDKILKATETNDIDLFHSVCNQRMKSFLTPEVFEPVSDQLSDTLKEGYELEVKSVKKDGIYETYNWWVKCKNGTKFTMNMSLDKKGAVAGCWMR